MPHIYPTNSDLPIAVDERDYLWLNSFKWRISGWGYAETRIKGKAVLMHKMICHAPKGMKVDHEDHNKLNNRRHNLRPATNKQNLANRLSRRVKAPYRGIYQSPGNQNWKAKIRYSGEGIHLGSYPDEKFASQVYDAAARILYDAFAVVNHRTENPLAREIARARLEKKHVITG